MSSNLIDIFLVLFLLISGYGSFVALEIAKLAFLPYSTKISIAASCRTISLQFYRFYWPYVQTNPTWVAFEWLIPVVVMGELVLAACGSADGQCQ